MCVHVYMHVHAHVSVYVVSVTNTYLEIAMNFAGKVLVNGKLNLLTQGQKVVTSTSTNTLTY